MPDLKTILSDPNYVNANAETKRAIFEKWAPQDPNYSQANAATQSAIRAKFGIETAPVAAEPAPAAPQRSLGQEALRQASLTGRYAVEGLTDLAGLVSEPIRALGEAAGLPATPSLREGVSGGLTALGVPNPETGTERVVGDVSRALAGGGAVVKGAQVLSKVPGAVQGLATELARAPGTQAAAITGGSGAAGAAREGGAGAGGQLAASILGSLIPLTPGAMATGSGWVMDATRGRLVEMRAGRILREVAGDRLGEIKTLLRKAGASDADITAAQATVDANAPTWQALGYTARAKSPEQYAALEAGQEQARRQALTDVTPDREAAMRARTAASRPLYQQSDTTLAPVTQDLQTILDRMPRGALRHAAELARIDGRPFIIGQNVPEQTVNSLIVDASGAPMSQSVVPGQQAQITGESLHYLKRALSDIASSAPGVRGVTRDTQTAVRGLMPDFFNVVEGLVPTYGQARAAFSELSPPVNQAQVLGEMSSVLARPGGGERVGPFLNVLGRGENALLRRSTGMPRFEQIEDVLTPEQVGAVRQVQNELTRDMQMTQQARAGETRLREIIGESNVVPQVPNPLRVEISILNRVLERVKGRVNQRTNDMLLQAMRRPEDALRLLEMVPAADRNTVLQAIRQAQGPAMATNALIGASQANSVPVTP